MASVAGGLTQAQAAAATHNTGFIGLQGSNGGVWPENGAGTSTPSDNGEAAAIKAAGLYLVGGLNQAANNAQSNDTSTKGSIAAIQYAVNLAGASANLIGYTVGDEPNMCDASQLSAVNNLKSYDPTRPVLYNTTRWFFGWNCGQAQATALWQAISINSFDEYTTVDQNFALAMRNLNYTRSDFQSASNDLLYLRGVIIQAARAVQSPGAPLWVYGEAGGDSWVTPYNTILDQNGKGGSIVTSGSTTIVNNSGFSKFTPIWIGMGLQGGDLPPGTTIVAIGPTVTNGVDGCTQAFCSEATMSAAALTTDASASIQVVGGSPVQSDSRGSPGRDCIDAYNLCLVTGQEHRTYPSEVNALAWMSIINGATGIEWFCDDVWATDFCLGDVSTWNIKQFRVGAAKAVWIQKLANSVATNLSYVNRSILAVAPVINSPTIGYCSMDSVVDAAAPTVATSTGCTGGILTLSDHAGSQLPGNAMVKSYSGAAYLFAQSTRRGQGVFDFRLAGLAGKTATVVYDSNAHYDPSFATVGKTFTLDGSGGFADTLGAGSRPAVGDPLNGYQTKIYQIQ